MGTYKQDDPWLLPFLGVVKTRPGMYLGDERVQTLTTYILAYTQAREDLGVPPYGPGEQELLEEFTYWLADRRQSDDNCSWPGHIRRIDASDANVHTFFRLFEEYLAERGKALPDFVGRTETWPAHPWSLKPMWPPKRP